MIMPRDKDCHPLQSIQLIPYVHLRSEGKFTRNLLKSGEKNSADFGVVVINGILIVRRITSIKFLELLNKQKMLFT